MQAPPAPRRPLVLPLLRQAYEIWSLEASWFLFYGFFMLAAAFALGQVPLVGLPLSLALDGPLSAGLVLATRRVTQGERPGPEDFMGGFHGARRMLLLAALSLLVSGLTVVGLVLLLVPGLIVAALLSVATPVLLLENRSLRGCLQRSTLLTRARLWPVAALALLQATLQALLSLPLVDSLLHGTEPTLPQVLPVFLGLGLLGPFHGILGTLLYFRLREESAGGELVKDL